MQKHESAHKNTTNMGRQTLTQTYKDIQTHNQTEPEINIHTWRPKYKYTNKNTETNQHTQIPILGHKIKNTYITTNKNSQEHK